MVKISVNLDRREKLRRLHTTTHIVNFCARQVLGNHVWQNGSNLKPEFGTLDITHYENLTREQINEIEKLANKVVFENKKVQIEELDRSEAEKKHGYILYQGGAIPMKRLRVIHVMDNDIEACGGIHMEETGGIGLIKLVESQKIQDGVVRLKYVVNEFALDEINKKQEILDGLREVFSVDEASILKSGSKFFNDWKEQKKEIDNLKNMIKSTYVSMGQERDISELLIGEDFDMGFMMELFQEIKKSKSSFKLESNEFIITTNDFKVENFKKEIDKKEFKIYIK